MRRKDGALLGTLLDGRGDHRVEFHDDGSLTFVAWTGDERDSNTWYLVPAEVKKLRQLLNKRTKPTPTAQPPGEGRR